MNDPSRSAFEAQLRELGYDELEPFDSEPCVHEAADECAMFVMPTRECKEADTYGALGWLVYEGCRDCCEARTRTLNCGGMFTHLRVFADGVLSERFDDDEIRPAAAAIDDDE